MHLLNEKLRGFFTPLLIFALMSLVLFLFSDINDYYGHITNLSASLLVFSSVIVMFLVYISYPLTKILLKNYGTIFQRINAILLLLFSALAIFFSTVDSINVLFIVLVCLAVFLNFSLSIGKKNNVNYILSYSIRKNRYLINVSLCFLLLIILTIGGFYYFDPYLILSILLSITLFISSIFYGKSDDFTFY